MKKLKIPEESCKLIFCLLLSLKKYFRNKEDEKSQIYYKLLKKVLASLTELLVSQGIDNEPKTKSTI